MKTTVGAVSAAFFGVVLSASAAGTFYVAELTNSWISASLVPDLSTAGGPAVPITTGDRWKAPTGGEAMATNQTIVFDTEVTDPLVYRPEVPSGAIALVNVKLLVDPNAAIPSTNGLGAAQAALTVVTNSASQCLEWVGLVRDGATNAWFVLEGDSPVQGSEYDVQIALDNRAGQKTIRYAVKQQSAVSYKVLRKGVNEWFDNPQNESRVSAVAFAGAGTVGSFSGDMIVNDGATIDSITDGRGYDFTNGTVTAVVTLPSDNSSGSTRTATLRLVKFDGSVQTYDAVTVTSGNEITWKLDNLTAGGVYSYSVLVKSGDTEREVKSGTFTAANWSSDDWFGLEIVNAQATTNNGTFAGAEFNVTKWDVGSDALFTVTDIAPGSNAVVRVDTKYAFETFIDSGSLEALEAGVLGGIVATSDGGGAWYAYTGASNDTSGWEALTGGFVPNTNTDYVIRAEFDFLYSPHRVRYLVKADALGPEFVPLAKGGSEWINLVNAAPGSLSSVAMTGRGYVKSINAKVADKAVVKDSTNKKFATIWDAIQNGTGPFTLLTNATLAPADVTGKKKTFTINKATFDMIIDRSELGKWRLKDNGDGSYILMKPGATYIFL